MRAILMRLRAEVRSRWRAWLSLALMFGVAAGAAIAAMAGARRTETAYPRFLRAQDAFHAFTGGGAEGGIEERYEAVKTHPAVADAVEIVIVGGELTVPAKLGRPERTITFPEAILAVDPTGRALYETNRAKVLEGRLADRARADEIMLPFTFADRYRIAVGDRLVAGVGFDFENFPAPAEHVPLRVVGIVAAPGDFESVGMVSFFPVPVTPALHDRYREILPPLNPETWMLAVHLRRGAGAAPAFKQSVERDLNIDVPVIEPVVRSGVQKTMRLYGAALWVLGALVAIAAATILGQTLARQQHLDAAEYPALRAMGATARQLLGLGMMRAGMIGGGAAALSVLVAFTLSPLTPIGTARVAEPDPGFALDAAAIGIGAAATLALVILLSVVPSLRAARLARLPEGSARAAGRPSRLAERVSRTSRSPAVVTGLRMALEPGRGRTAVPVRSTILAVAIGVAAVTGAAVVGRSLSHLVATPTLIGLTYDAIVPGVSDEGGEEAVRRLREFPFIDQTTEGTGLNAAFNGVDSFIVGFEDGNPIGFATIEGRAPTDADAGGMPEIALGPTTIRRVGLRLGDVVEFFYATEDESGEHRSAQQGRVVGIAAIPPLPWAATEPGEGAVMTVGAIRRFSPGGAGGCCFVRFTPGTDLDAARARLEDAGFGTFLRTKRADLGTLERITRLPVLLSAIFGIMAAGALAHVLVTGLRRRRRDLAILKTLGFVTRQVRSAVVWQASTIAVLCVAAGIPAGIALGRWGWRLIASQFGVVPVSVAPLALVALLVPAAVALATLVSALPARAAARTRPALVLRTE